MRRINHSRHILKRILALEMVITAITIAAISFVSYYAVETAFRELVTKKERNVLGEANQRTAYLLRDLESISDRIYINKEIRDLLYDTEPPEDGANTDANPEQVVNDAFIQNFFTGVQLPYRWMKYDAYIFGFNGYKRRYSSASNAQTNILFEQVIKAHWLEDVIERTGRPMIIDGSQSDLPGLSNRILHTRLLKNLSNNQPTGVFIMSLSKQVFEYLYESMLSDPNARFFVADAQGDVVWSSGELPIDRSLLTEAFATPDRDSFEARAGEQRLQVLFTPIESTDWYLVELIDLDALFSFTGQLKWMVILLCGASVVLMILFTAQMSRHFYRPIGRLLAAMRKAGTGRFETAELDIARQDEIGALNLGFVDMTRELNRLLARLVEEQEAKRLAEMQALQAQIKPHFLYNTLSSIRCVVSQGDGETAQKMIIALVKVLKNSLDASSECITLRQELENLKHYALIFQMRYANFDMDTCVEDAALNCQVPRMILQPLVENAIVHGYESGEGSIRIAVYAYVQAARLIVEVVDDGAGISDERRAQLFDEDGRLRHIGDSVGLRNVSERVKKAFGEDYGLELIHHGERGTRIRLTMPECRAEGSAE